MSYNVRVAFPGEDRDRWERRKESVSSTIYFHRPDIVGLQEPTDRQLSDLRERLPGYRWIGVGRRDGETDGEYCPIGYRPNRFDLENHATFWLSASPDEPGSIGWDAAYPRLATQVELRDIETDARIRVFNTHFDHEGEMAREESARLLRRRINSTGRQPTVVTGDFNCVADSAPYRILTDSSSNARRLVDAMNAAERPHHGPRATYTDFDSPSSGRKIDHVFVTPDVQVRQHATCADTRPDGRFPSDHLPLVADVALPAGDGSGELSECGH
ncbi:endonuclease/exonuclease/phosphatase family protein [Halorussus salinisoli]|uniref:endonuclease/exonuclease/phosphatase family protein n=1 Tax=Halorussus salinisoli TaxID=2558242 RepID=UPI0010C1C7F9|nr:endonuclease/exonuclease/phosphatase family protein [Halorussus salinisoli]